MNAVGYFSKNIYFCFSSLFNLFNLLSKITLQSPAMQLVLFFVASLFSVLSDLYLGLDTVKINHNLALLLYHQAVGKFP